jgi:hypothetical protein
MLLSHPGRLRVKGICLMGDRRIRKNYEIHQCRRLESYSAQTGALPRIAALE